METDPSGWSLGGWISNTIMRSDAQQGALLNAGVGVVGSLLGAWFIAPRFGSGTINQNDFSATGLMSSLLVQSYCWQSSTSSGAGECVEFVSPTSSKETWDKSRWSHKDSPAVTTAGPCMHE